MTIVFRTDSSLQIGSGHVMRCLTLADKLRQRGVDVMFVCRTHPGHLIGLIEDKGYKVVRLQQSESEYITTPEDVAHAAWLGVSWQQDAADSITAVGDTQPEWLIIDHYAIDRRWEQTLRPHAGKIMVIDDLADRSHECDLLLDQNLYRDMETRYDDLVPVSCRKLLGPKYAQLRPEFAIARKQLRQRDGLVRRVLVFFGGVDPTNETEKALQALAAVVNRNFSIDVVVGGGNLHKEKIENFCAANDNFNYHCQVDNMAAMMEAADLAIGAGGTATWERCSVGLPSILTAVADNQIELTETGAERGLFFSLGRADNVPTGQLIHTLECIRHAPGTLSCFTSNCLATLDAKGTSRVANIIVPLNISLRTASLEDCDFVFGWRNAEETRRYIFDAKPIPLEQHQKWFRKTLADPNRVMLIGEIENRPVGVLRYDLMETEALISVYLVPGIEGNGIGSRLIQSGSQWMREQYPCIKAINAEIFKENVASLRAFESAGYKEHHAMYKEVL